MNKNSSQNLYQIRARGKKSLKRCDQFDLAQKGKKCTREHSD